jgi:hypothetical protein
MAAGFLVRLDSKGKPVKWRRNGAGWRWTKLNGLNDLSGDIKIADVKDWAPEAEHVRFVKNSCTGKLFNVKLT